MKKSTLKQMLVVAGEALLLTGITVFSVMPVSCKITEQGVKVLAGDYVPPVLNSFEVKDENTLVLEFSEKVFVTGYVTSVQVDELFDSMEHSATIDLSPAIERASGVYGLVPSNVSTDDSGCIVTVSLENQMEVGQGYEFYSQVEDICGNTLTLAVPFTGFNSRLPQLVITELQSESVNQNKTEKTKGTYRNEFVEFLVLKSGNLAGLELCSGYDGEAKKYVFPPLEVTAGQIFVVHMRNRGNGCISEEGDDLDLAFSSYAKNGVRDLWSSSETTAIGNKTDILIIRNKADQRLLDAVMFRASGVEAWTKTMIEYSQLIDESGIYESGDIENAFICDGLSATKTLQRADAAELLQRLNDGEEIEYPVKSGPDTWLIAAEGSPGLL